MSHDSLPNFASCQSSLGTLSVSQGTFLPPTSNCPNLCNPSQNPRAMEDLSRAAPGPGKMDAAVVWLNSFQHSPNSPAHDKGTRTGRSMGELSKQLIQGRGLRTDNSLTWTSLLRKREATWGPSAPPGTAALSTPVRLGLSGGEGQYGGCLRVGQTSGPLRPATVTFRTSCFLPKTYLQSQIQNQKIRGHTEHSPPAGRGERRGCFFLHSTPSPPQKV